jgi:hypothetical protein
MKFRWACKGKLRNTYIYTEYNIAIDLDKQDHIDWLRIWTFVPLCFKQGIY